jgi:hypothetical protein
VLTLLFEDGTSLEVTADHPVWVIEGDGLASRPQLHFRDANEDSGFSLPGRWVHSQALRVGDQVYGRDRGQVRIRTILSRQDSLSVYNLSVLGLPYYSVGQVGVLVHNTESNRPAGNPGPGSELPVYRDPKSGQLSFIESDPPSLRGSNNPKTQEAALRGTELHQDKPGNLPDQLRQRYPDTEFEFKGQGERGQDVTVTGGKHPSEYPESNWPKDIDHGDFKPDTSSGKKTFDSDQRTKWEEPTVMLPYDPEAGALTD